MHANKILKKAHWLTVQEQSILANALKCPQVQSLSDPETEKLTSLLCSILYAEKVAMLDGKIITFWLEKLLRMLKLHPFLGSTLGKWNVHICHAHRFGYSKREFRKILENQHS